MACLASVEHLPYWALVCLYCSELAFLLERRLVGALIRQGGHTLSLLALLSGTY